MIALIMLDFPVEYPAYEDMIEGRHFYPLSYRYDNGKCIGGPHYTLLIRFLTRSGDTLPYTQRWLNFISAGDGLGYPNSYCVYKHPEVEGMQWCTWWLHNREAHNPYSAWHTMHQINDNVHSLVLRQDGETFTVYVDGEERRRLTIWPPPDNTVRRPYAQVGAGRGSKGVIGRNMSKRSSGANFVGTMYAVAHWERSLSIDEVRGLSNGIPYELLIDPELTIYSPDTERDALWAREGVGLLGRLCSLLARKRATYIGPMDHVGQLLHLMSECPLDVIRHILFFLGRTM